MVIKIDYKDHKIREFRIVLPMSVEEYHVGQLWSVAQASKNETGGGEGVEVQKNEPFDLSNVPEDKKYLVPQSDLYANGQKYTKGQYTFKVYYLSQKVPKFVRMIAPNGSLVVYEEAWNAYPYCRTTVTNEYMKDNMYITIETFHYADAGKSENIHNLKGRDLEQRQVVKIDVANDKVQSKDYKPEWDPCKVAAPKSGRPNPLPQDKTGAWMNTQQPVMTCYKLVKVWFKWWGLQSKMESFIMTAEQRLFTNFHRQVVCWQDNFHGMTIADIRKLEDDTKAELEKQRKEGPVRGTTAADEK